MRWTFPVGQQRRAEVEFAERLRAGSRFYRFLFEVREELFDDAFQAELAEAYEPRGQAPCPPALLAMVNLLQRYEGCGDRSAVETAENDRRWQLVLGSLDRCEAPFGQGSLVRFRERIAAHGLDRKLVDRTIELAKRTKKFGWKNLKVALDSSPLDGAGRVEDTWNLIGHAMSKVVGAVAKATGVHEDVVIEGAGLTVLDGTSLKAALDIDWSDTDERHRAFQRLITEAELLTAWVQMHIEAATKPPISDALLVLRTVVEQDIEPDPDGGGDRIREGVAEDRRISISDPDMRHGRKSRSKTINGYKRHVIIANGFILGTAIAPANAREHDPTKQLIDAARKHGAIESAHFDRGYLPSDEFVALRRQGVALHSRAWRGGAGGLFGKESFQIFLDEKVVVCPAMKMADITPCGTATFDEKTCTRCPIRRHCTRGRKRTVAIHPNEAMLMELRRKQQSATGRAAYRERTAVEHRLARVAAVQGSKARYRGLRKNEMDLNRTAAVINLQEIARLRAAA
jgi:hypothetical protein